MGHSELSKQQFAKVYKRASKTPFDDFSNMLWLASIEREQESALSINYSKYIYVHREADGSICGLSISKMMLEENSELNSRYISGKQMYGILLKYASEMSDFCQHFESAFVDIFLMPPKAYFATASVYWQIQLSGS